MSDTPTPSPLAQESAGAAAGRTLVLPDQVTMGNAQDVISMLLPTLDQATSGDVVVDASLLQRLDSSVLAVLLECRRRARVNGAGLRVSAAPRQLTDLIRLYGAQDLLQVA